MRRDSEGQRHLRWRLFVGSVILLLILAGIAGTQLHRGIRVIVTNTGQSPIRSVVLHVTGNSYSLGDIAPGATKEATVNSTGESDVAVEFEDAIATRLRQDVGVYIEPGYQGTIQLSIKGGQIDRKSHDIY